jgi:heterodisulfide reductase subunit A
MKKLYLCTCNNTIDKILDFNKIKDEMKEDFDEIEIVDSLCLEDGLSSIAENLDKEDRVVLGACSSQLLEVPVSRKVKTEYVTYVPLREHVAWVHSNDKVKATNKSIVLLNDAATQLEFLVPKTDVKDETLNEVLVIGGSIAGLKITSDLLKLGLGVTLQEPPDWTDNDYLRSSIFMDDEDIVASEIKSLLKASKKAKRINDGIKSVEGHVGRYLVTLDNESKELVLCSSIIIAQPPEEKEPKNAKKYLFGKSKNVSLLSGSSSEISDLEGSSVFIIAQSDYSSKPKDTHLLRKSKQIADQGNTVFLVHQHIQTEDEELYRAARRAGVIFVRGDIKKVEEKKGSIKCVITNSLEGIDREITVDRILLQTTLVTRKGTHRLAESLGVDIDEVGFIKTRYSKMKPVQTTRRGIFIAGNTKMPMTLSEELASAQNATLEAVKIATSSISRKGWIPVIDEEKCDVCKACIEACPNDALRLVENKVEHIPAHCEFCGICVSACPTRAIEFQSYGKESWFARLERIGETHKKLEGDSPYTLVYACSECANASIDQAGFTGKEYPAESYVLQVPCAGMISPIEILKGLVVGAEHVIVAHCPPGGCHHQTGDKMSEMVVDFTKDMLKEIGQNPDRVKVTYMIAALPNKMQEEVS